MVASPAANHAMWNQRYLHRFVGDDPFRRCAIDVKTLAMVGMGAGYRATTKSSLPRHWCPRAKHTHVAVDNAVEQGELFVNIVHEFNVQRGDVALTSQTRQTAKTYRRQRRQERLRRSVSEARMAPMRNVELSGASIEFRSGTRRAPPASTSALTTTNSGATRNRRPKKRDDGCFTRRRHSVQHKLNRRALSRSTGARPCGLRG